MLCSFSDYKAGYVVHLLGMAHGNPAFSDKTRISCGAHLLPKLLGNNWGTNLQEGSLESNYIRKILYE